MFNPWGQVWWEVYLSTFGFIVLSLTIGFLALCIIALLIDKPPAGKQKGLRKHQDNYTIKRGKENGIKRNA